MRKAHEVLKAYLEEHTINQKELVEGCERKGYQISQSSVSKVISGKKKMSLEECAAFCDVLGISADMLLFQKEEKSSVQDDFFSLSERDIEGVQGIVGRYEIAYQSTAQEEKGRMMLGNLTLSVDGKFIHAQLNIDIENGNSKIYKGYMYLHDSWPVAYIVVKRSETGEIAVLSLRYRVFSEEPMKCRMALCLSTSAGEKKEPIVHHAVLVRQETNDSRINDMRKRIQSYLRLLYHLEQWEDMGLYQDLNEWSE